MQEKTAECVFCRHRNWQPISRNASTAIKARSPARLYSSSKTPGLSSVLWRHAKGSICERLLFLSRKRYRDVPERESARWRARLLRLTLREHDCCASFLSATAALTDCAAVFHSVLPRCGPNVSTREKLYRSWRIRRVQELAEQFRAIAASRGRQQSIRARHRRGIFSPRAHANNCPTCGQLTVSGWDRN